jgi:hypothetical protein
MIGEILGNSSGRMTGIRVLAHNKLEVSFQGGGKLLGVEMTDIGTYTQTVKAGGVLHGEGQVIMITKDGDMATWTGFGIGKPTGDGFKASYAVAGSIQTESPNLASLNSMTVVTEYDVEENGDFAWTLWQWKSKADSG